jgi:hypothetical protein
MKRLGIAMPASKKGLSVNREFLFLQPSIYRDRLVRMAFSSVGVILKVSMSLELQPFATSGTLVAGRGEAAWVTKSEDVTGELILSDTVGGEIR